MLWRPPKRLAARPRCSAWPPSALAHIRVPGAVRWRVLFSRSMRSSRMLAVAESSLGRVLPLLWAGFEPNYTATLLGRGTKGTWACRTCIAEHVDVDCCGGANSGMRLAMISFLWVLLRSVGGGAAADGFHVLLTSAVGRGGCFTVGHQPYQALACIHHAGPSGRPSVRVIFDLRHHYYSCVVLLSKYRAASDRIRALGRVFENRLIVHE